MRNQVEIERSYKRFEEIVNLKAITPYKMAKELGISTTTISSWKAGKYEPCGRTLYKISKYLEIPISYFYE